MNTEEDKAKDEAIIRKLIAGFVKAIRTKDINIVMSILSPDIISFDLGPPLQHGGGASFRERWQVLFASYLEPIEYEIRDLYIHVSADTAFSHSLNRVGGTLKNGQKTDRWIRWTACYRKINGKWLIVHEHVSVPVDLSNASARLDLKP